MRRLALWLLNAVTALSLPLWVEALWLLVRSYRTADEVHRFKADLGTRYLTQTELRAISDSGGIMLFRWQILWPNDRIDWQGVNRNIKPGWGHPYHLPTAGKATLSYDRGFPSPPVGPPPASKSADRHARGRGNGRTLVGGGGVVLPLWSGCAWPAWRCRSRE